MSIILSTALDNPVTLALAATGSGVRYDVGPGYPYTELTTVPWATLGPGDVVNIHYRATPYVGKFGVRAEGTALNPVVINGVTDASGNRPQISGAGATTASGSQNGASSVFSSNYLYGELLGVIVVKARPAPPGNYSTEWPGYLTIQNLEISGALNADTWTDLSGATHNYSSSAGIYVLHGHDILLKNNKIHDCGFGVFVQEAKDTTGNWYVRDLRIESNKVYNNGVPGSYLEHNLYVQAVRPTIIGNYIGQVRSGSLGSSYKSRSAGERFAYNVVVASARGTDFVHAEGQSGPIDQDSQYGETWCYGNLIINDFNEPSGASYAPIHFGSDQSMEDGAAGSPLITDADLAPGSGGAGTGPQRYAKRNLFFYNNTVLMRGTAAQSWRVHVFDLSLSGTPLSPRTTCWEWNNVFVAQGTSNYSWLKYAGRLEHKGGSRVLTDGGIGSAHDNADAAKWAINGAVPAGAIVGDFAALAGNNMMPTSGGNLDNAAVGTPSGLPSAWVGNNVVAMPNGSGGSGVVTRGAVQDIGAFDNYVAAGGNNPPVLASAVPSQTGAVGTPFSYTIPAGTFTDPDGDTLTYSIAGQPAWMSFNAGTRTLSGTPTAGGMLSVSVVATDPSGTAASTGLQLTISGSANQAPVVASYLINQTATAGVPFSYTFAANTFSDPNGDVLTYTATGMPAWMTFTPATRTFSGTPAAAGLVTVTVVAADPAGAIASDYFDLTISPAATGGNVAAIIQKGDLAASSFTNNNTNAAGGIKVNTAPGSDVAQAIAAAVAAIPAEKFVTSGAYNAVTDTLTLTFTDSSTVTIPFGAVILDAVASIPAAGDTTAGLVQLAVAANYPGALLNDTAATTPAYVNTAIGAAIANQPLATATATGTVSLAAATEVTTAPLTSDTEATTPAYVNAVLALRNCANVLADLNRTTSACHTGADVSILDNTLHDLVLTRTEVSATGGAVIPPQWTHAAVDGKGAGLSATLTVDAGSTRSGVMRQRAAAGLHVGPNTNSWLIYHAGAPTQMMVGAATYDSAGALIGFNVQWPDGGTGVYTATAINSVDPSLVDGYTVTYVGPTSFNGVAMDTPWKNVTRTVTQPPITRNASGAVTNRPPRTVA